MTINIKAAQLNKNDKIAETSTNNLRTPAKITAEGRSFVDEMISMPKMDSAKPEVLTQNQNVEAKTQVKNSNENKSFDFISTPDFKDVFNKDNKVLDRQAKHKAAEKELVDEIVLMNNKQNEGLKKSVKTEFNFAQSSVAQKSDKIVESEKQNISNSKNEKTSVIFEKNVEIPKQNFEKENNIVQKNVVPEAVAQDFETVDIDSVKPEVLTIAEGFEEEVILPAKNESEEFFAAPEALKQFSEPEFMVEDKVVEKLNANESLLSEQPVQVKEFKPEVKEFEPPIVKQEVKSEKETFEQPVQVQEFKPEVKEFEQPIVKSEVKSEKETFEQPIQVSEFKPEVKEFEQPIVKSEVKSEKETFEQPIQVSEFKPEVNVLDESEMIKFVQPEKSEEIKSVISANIPVKKESEIKTENKVKSIFDKALTEKSEIKPEFENVGKVKDIAEDINVKAVDIKPLKVEDIKVIKMEMPNPLVDLNNSLNTNKTSDIVKFIDANLSTTSTKTNKSSSSKASSSVKKSEEKAIKMTEADAKFFNNLVEANQQSAEIKTIEQNNLMKDVETAQAAKVSKTLLNALKESQETNKSFRVDFDQDISVVLKVNKNGHISAEFLPGDEAVEQYLRTNIPLLKQKFSDEGLEYDSLSYRQNKKESNEDRQRNNNRGNKKENGYE